MELYLFLAFQTSSLSEKAYLIQGYGKGKSSMKYVIADFNEQFSNTNLTLNKAWWIVKRFIKKIGNANKEKKQTKNYDEDDAATFFTVHFLRKNPKLSLKKRATDININTLLVRNV